MSVLLALILLSAPGCTFPPPEVPPLPPDLTIMSFNIRYDTAEDGRNQWAFRRNACIEMIQQIRPSILGIQEALHHQLVELLAALPEYAMIGVGRDNGQTQGEYCAILYRTERFDLVEQGTFWLSETPSEPSFGWDAACKRIVTWLQLSVKGGGQTVALFNTHLDHEGSIARAESTTKLLAERIRDLTALHATVFITGDFNAIGWSSIFDPILETFLDARKTAPRTDRTRSYNAWGSFLLRRNIDYIFYAGAEAIEFRTVDDDYGVPFISDHYPILASFSY